MFSAHTKTKRRSRGVLKFLWFDECSKAIFRAWGISVEGKPKFRTKASVDEAFIRKIIKIRSVLELLRRFWQNITKQNDKQPEKNEFYWRYWVLACDKMYLHWWPEICTLKGAFHTTPEKFENDVFALKTHQMFSFHTTPEKFENATINLCLRKSYMKSRVVIVTSSFILKSSVFKMFSLHTKM